RWITSAGNLGHTPTTALGSSSVPVQRQVFRQRLSTSLFWKAFPFSIPKQISGMSILPLRSWPTRWRISGGEINCSPPAWKVQVSSQKAWPGYTAMGVAEDEFGFDYQQRLLSILRQEYSTPKSKADVPLLRGNEWFHNYRKGPLALYALSSYIGRDKVNLA